MNNLKLSFTILHRMMHNSIITLLAILIIIGIIIIVSVLPAPKRDRVDVENISLENCSAVELIYGDETTKIYKVKCLTEE